MPSKKTVTPGTHKKVNLFRAVSLLIESTHKKIVATVNTELVMLYWQIGKSIKQNLLRNKRAGYGEEIIASLSKRLTEKYGKGWSKQQLLHCLRSA